jgi:hypothetical protein
MRLRKQLDHLKVRRGARRSHHTLDQVPLRHRRLRTWVAVGRGLEAGKNAVERGTRSTHLTRERIPGGFDTTSKLPDDNTDHVFGSANSRCPRFSVPLLPGQVPKFRRKPVARDVAITLQRETDIAFDPIPPTREHQVVPELARFAHFPLDLDDGAEVRGECTPKK